MGKRQEAAKLTRQKIIDAVRTLSETKRFDEMSIDDITTAAGVAKGTFYVYFKRREDVVAEIAYENFGCLSDEILSRDISSLEKIQVFLNSSEEMIEDSTLEITQQWFKAVVAPLDDESLGKRKLDFDLDFVRKCIIAGLDNSEFSGLDADMTARQIVSEYYGAVILWCMTNGETDLKAIIRDFTAAQLQLLLRR